MNKKRLSQDRKCGKSVVGYRKTTAEDRVSQAISEALIGRMVNRVMPTLDEICESQA